MFFKFLDLFDSCNVQAVTIFPFHSGSELYIYVQNTLVNPTVIDQLESKFLGRYNHTELTRGLALKASPFYKFRPKFSPCVLALISIDTVIFSSLDDNNNTSILKSLKVQAKENPSFICFVQTTNHELILSSCVLPISGESLTSFKVLSLPISSRSSHPLPSFNFYFGVRI
jgi:hypothetical protein